MENDNQHIAIETTEGPMLIIAGPGTGKTFTLVKRIANIIKTNKAIPEEIMAVTFTEKAARELLTRLSDEFARQNITANLNEMYIGTFHSICLRILKENLFHAAENENIRIIDSFEAAYLVCRNMDKFEFLGGFNELFPASMGKWNRALEVCRYVSLLSEELVDVDKMADDKSNDMQLLSKIIKRYNEILDKHNFIDFSSMQTKTYDFLKNSPDVLEKLQNKLKYIMVDEYQDTNYVQEQLMFLLAGETQNICVVGDDDQGMYRFRGATIRNILEFPDKFPDQKCRIIHLDVNYRSEPEIIDFYNRWMENQEGVDLFNWNKYRYPKNIRSSKARSSQINSVFKCIGDNNAQKMQNILNMIFELKSKNCIADYNQIAFLFRSVKNREATELAAFLENNGIPVYSPRSEMFFNSVEIKQIIGCLIMCFQTYFSDLKKNEFTYPINDELRKYYKNCINEALVLINENKKLHNDITCEYEFVSGLSGESNKSFLDIFYKLISNEPFKNYLSADMNDIILATKAARNLSEFSRMIAKFSDMYDMHLLNISNKAVLPEQFFNEYIKYLYIDGVGEYEDISEYAPHGCVSFMTIHQSKGLEFPVVVVGSLNSVPKRNTDVLIYQAENRFFHRAPFEPLSDIKYFDFWRLYYTAFSRAQNMLILSGERSKTGVFYDYMKNLPDIVEFNPSGQKFAEIKPIRYKKVYSFTSHIALYDGCPKQYKFYKEYGFAQNKMLHTSIGSLVHETLKSINDLAIEKRFDEINENKIKELFEIDLESITARTGFVLTDEQKKNALGHVIRYYFNRKDELYKALKAEEEIDLILDNYILQGIIDLIEYDASNDTLEIIDYKTGPKPSADPLSEKVEHYRKQLEIYAYLAEKRFNKKVSHMKLYYTSVNNGDPYIVFENDTDKIQKTINEVNETIYKIENKIFDDNVRNNYACKFCDMRFVCGKQECI